jgi:hypothetical protein
VENFTCKKRKQLTLAIDNSRVAASHDDGIAILHLLARSAYCSVRISYAAGRKFRSELGHLVRVSRRQIDDRGVRVELPRSIQQSGHDVRVRQHQERHLAGAENFRSTLEGSPSEAGKRSRSIWFNVISKEGPTGSDESPGDCRPKESETDNPDFWGHFSIHRADFRTTAGRRV